MYIRVLAHLYVFIIRGSKEQLISIHISLTIHSILLAPTIICRKDVQTHDPCIVRLFILVQIGWVI